MESKEQLRKIAIYCDEYDSTRSNLRSGDSSEDRFDSCINCTHYVNHGCELDLIDKVLSAMSMDLDLK